MHAIHGYQCECGAEMVTSKMQDDSSMLRVACLNRSCERRGQDRFVLLSEVAEHLLKAKTPENAAG